MYLCHGNLGSLMTLGNELFPLITSKEVFFIELCFERHKCILLFSSYVRQSLTQTAFLRPDSRSRIRMPCSLKLLLKGCSREECLCKSQTQVMVSFQRLKNHSQVKFSLLRPPGVSVHLALLLLIWGCFYCVLWVLEANSEVSCGQKCHADVTSLTEDPPSVFLQPLPLWPVPRPCSFTV